MRRRSSLPRWRLLALAALIVIVVAGLSATAVSLSNAMDETDGVGAKEWLAIAAVLGPLACVFVIPPLVIAALFLPPRRAVDPGWRRHLTLYRTRRPLIPERPDPEAVQTAWASMSDDALRVAAILPEHSEKGRAAARLALLSRGAALEPIPTIEAPSFHGPEDLADARRAVRDTRRIRTLCRIATAGLFGALFLIVGANVVFLDRAVARATAETYSPEVLADLKDLRLETLPPDILAWPEMDGVQTRNAAARSLGLLILPVIAALALSYWLRARPLRILLVRRFSDRRLDRAFGKWASRNLSDFGHVFSLGDRQIGRSTFAWIGGMAMRGALSIPAFIMLLVSFPILLVLRAVDRTRWGPAFVGSARDFRLLAGRLFDRVALNAETAFLSSSYPIHTSEAWRGLVERLMLDAADVVILDLSGASYAAASEIKALTQSALWDRVVPVAMDVHEAEARARLAGIPSDRLHLYDAEGRLASSSAFQEDVFRALERSVRKRQDHAMEVL